MASLYKLTGMDSEFKLTSAAKRKFSWPEIEAHNSKPFDVPNIERQPARDWCLFFIGRIQK